MLDLTKLFGNILGGITGDQPVKRKNGPPLIEMTPSQEAISGAAGHLGHESIHSMGNEHGGDKGAIAKNIFGGFNQAFQNTMANVAPVQQAQFDLDPGYEQRQQAYGMPRFRQGGYLPPGGFGLVGDGGPDPTDDEIIRARPGGGVDIIPNPAHEQQHDMMYRYGRDDVNVPNPELPQSIDAPSGGVALGETGGLPPSARRMLGLDTGGEPYGVEQTIQGDDQPVQPNPAAQAMLSPHTLGQVETQEKAVRGRERPSTLAGLRDLAIKDSEVHSNGWKDALFGALSGVNQSLNGGPRETRTYSEIKRDRRIKPTLEKIAMMEHQGDYDLGQAAKRAQIETTRRDDERQERSARELSDWRKGETIRKISDSQARERTSRMRTVAGMLKDLPAFVPGDPKFKEIEAALGDVGLPITQKDAKKKVDLKQDQRTGAWTIILTDPISGKQEARDVVKDGKPFASTPTVVMQGEYGMFKQDDAQQHDTEERAKDRNQRQQQFLLGFQSRLASEMQQFANDAQKTAQWKANWIKKIQEDRATGKMDDDTAEKMLQLVQ